MISISIANGAHGVVDVLDVPFLSINLLTITTHLLPHQLPHNGHQLTWQSPANSRTHLQRCYGATLLNGGRIFDNYKKQGTTLQNCAKQNQPHYGQTDR